VPKSPLSSFSARLVVPAWTQRFPSRRRRCSRSRVWSSNSTQRSLLATTAEISSRSMSRPQRVARRRLYVETQPVQQQHHYWLLY